jgi:two-component system CheB/CheR fusion protein
MDEHVTRVLVIEDNVDAADTLKEALELGAHEVEVAYSGPQGLAKAREFHPDIVVCDIGLPGMSGYELAQAFRADAELRSCALVALTGYAMPEDERRAEEAGFDEHLTKPADLGVLERLLGQLGERRTLH